MVSGGYFSVDVFVAFSSFGGVLLLFRRSTQDSSLLALVVGDESECDGENDGGGYRDDEAVMELIVGVPVTV